MEVDFVQNVFDPRWNGGIYRATSDTSEANPVSLFPVIAAHENRYTPIITKICAANIHGLQLAGFVHGRETAPTVSAEASIGLH